MFIIPHRLRRLRDQRGISRKELADISHVSPKQIQRLEDPKQASTNVRRPTLDRLARALGVQPKELTGEPPSPEGSKPIRISAGLPPGVRLAYELIERRYGVTIGEIVTMAPLYFALLAEGSLLWRRTELEDMQAAIDRVNARTDSRRKRFGRWAWHATEDSGYEENAIAQGDLFGDPLPPDYDHYADEEWDGSPFADYLRKLADDIGKPEVIDLEPHSHGRVGAQPGTPGYRIYTEDLERIGPLDGDAMYALHVGDAHVYEIPTELMVDDAKDSRCQWLEGRLSPESRRWLDDFHRISAELSRSLLDSNADDGTVPQGEEQ